jgi:DNA polymerase-1
MYKCVTEFLGVREYLAGADMAAFDFETAPLEEYRGEERAALDAHKARIAGISFSNAKDNAIYVPLAHITGRNAEGAGEIWEWLKGNFFENTSVIKIAHNLAFEAMFLYSRGIVIQPPVYDTIAAAQLTLKGNMTFRGLGDSGLKTLASELLGANMPRYEEVTQGRAFDELDPADTATVRYACADSDYALRLFFLFNKWFDKYLPRHRYIVEQIESSTAVYCGIMKYNGLLADVSLMENKRSETEERLEFLRSEIAFITGEAGDRPPVNIGANASTSAFKKYLYVDLGLPILKTTAKTRGMQAALPPTDDETLILLSEWCGKNRPELAPLFKLVKEYRRLGKIKSTYIDGYAGYVNKATGRIHADLFPLGTETGRFAARNPNLQNMPRAGADSTGVRDFFTAPEGCVLMSLDFSQIELRVGAFYCRDEKMLETYREGGDIHEQTAAVIFGGGKHGKEQRTIAKNVNFGTFFGLFPGGLQRTLKFKAGLDRSLVECEKIIANLKAGYPAIVRWQEETKKKAGLRRYSETYLGRRRYLPDINSEDWNTRAFAERRSLNTPIQGTAADILKLALGRIIEGLPYLPWMKPLLQIHDELVFELPEEKTAEAAEFVKKRMEACPFPGFDVPVIADVSVGKRFGQLEELGAEK